MKFIIAKKNINNVIAFLIVFLTILMSKTYYFGVLNRTSVQYIYYILVILGFLISGLSLTRLKRSIPLALTLILVLIINLSLYYFNMHLNQINTILGFIIAIIMAVLVCSCLTIRQFSDFYIMIISAYSIISIPCVFIANYFPEIALTLTQPGYNWQVPFGYSPYYTWGINGVINVRNSGPFWEPGAFQGFLIIAILMVLFETTGKTLRHKKIITIILFITALTTQSTTGYFLLIIIIFTQWEKLTVVFNHKGELLRNILVIFIAIGILVIILQSGNISNKISENSNNMSAKIRSGDIIGGFALSLRGGPFGLGVTDSMETMRMLFGVYKDDSAGLLSMTYTFGWFFAIVYIYTMCRGLKYFFNINKKKDIFIIILIFIILHLTESLWYLPVYLAIIFYQNGYKQSKSKL